MESILKNAPITKIIKAVDERVKINIVREIESGKISQSAAAREYGFSRTVVQKWVRQYGMLRTRTKLIRVVMADEKEKIQELQSALGDAHLKLKLYEKMLELASKECGMDIKKKFATKVSESSDKKGEK